MIRASFLALLWLFTSQCFAAQVADDNASCHLERKDISLGELMSKETYVAKLSPHGRWLGSVDIYGTGRVWDLRVPEHPVFEISGDPSISQIFEYVNFSPDGSYLIFDSVLANTNIATAGRIYVIDLATWEISSFDTYIWGGTSRSKFTISSSGILAYVPKERAHEVRMVNLAMKSLTSSFTVDKGDIGALAFNPSGHVLAIKDLSGEHIALYDVNTGTLKKSLPLDVPMPDDISAPDQSVFFWGNGSMLAVNSDQNELATGFSAESGRGQFPFDWFEPLAMFMSNNTHMLAIADFTATINVEVLGEDSIYQAQPFGPFSFTLAGAFSPSDAILAVGSDHSAVAILAKESNQLATLCTGVLPGGGEMAQIVFSSEHTFWSLTENFTLSIWTIGN